MPPGLKATHEPIEISRSLWRRWKSLDALYEGYAQKGFGVLGIALDGSPVLLGSTATGEPIEIPRSLWGRWRSLDGHRAKKPVDQEKQQP